MRLNRLEARQGVIPDMDAYSGTKVLYIDSPRQGRDAVIGMLEAVREYRFLTVSDLPEALRLLANEEFAAVLLGGCLLEAGERSLDRVIRALNRWSPVITLLEGAPDTLVDRLLLAGAEECLDLSELSEKRLSRAIHAAIVRRNRNPVDPRTAGMRRRLQAAAPARDETFLTGSAILDSIGDALLVVDELGYISYLNPIAETLLQTSYSEAVGQSLHDLVTVVDEEFGVLIDPLTLSGERPPVSQPLFLSLPDGNRQPVQCSAWQLNQLTNVERQGTILLLHDAGEIYKRLQKASYDASHDPLTGVLNRREIYRRIERAMELTQDHDLKHSLIYFDLDGFKQVNDVWGHAAGDRLLRELTRMLLETLRGRDSIGRLGGDEFVVLLEYCPVGAAVEVADQIRQLVRGIQVEEHKQASVSASISVVPIDGGCQDVDALIRQADAACYLAKHKGKDCIEVHRAG